MLDQWSIKLYTPLLSYVTRYLHKKNIKADHITILGFIMGIFAPIAIIFNQFYLGLLLIIINRIFDGIDGVLARKQGITKHGGFLDIVCDFIFYPLVILGFIFNNPSQYAVAGVILIFSFIPNMTSFLAFSSLYQKEQKTIPKKSLYYMTGIAEGTETVIFFTLFCLFPSYFSLFAYIFAAICLISSALRIYEGYKILKQAH